MALENHVEMSERVNSRWFRIKSAAVHALERRLPDKYVSRYELVSFSTTPYSKIKARIRTQNAVLAGAIAAVAGILIVVWRLI
jgi:kynurenine 3-monooxygenase